MIFQLDYKIDYEDLFIDNILKKDMRLWEI